MTIQGERNVECEVRLMTINKLKRKISFRKKLLNLLTRCLSPTNKFVVYVSQDLDKFISMHQKFIYNRHSRRRGLIKATNSLAA